MLFMEERAGERRFENLAVSTRMFT